MSIKYKVLFLTLITSSQSNIQINVTTASKIIDSVTSYSGADNKLVTEKEIKVFNITDDNLKRGVRVELGRRPHDVFLKDPTPYYNLYEKYKWPQVMRQIQVKRVKVVDIVNENITLKIHNVINNTTRKIKKKVEVKEDVENTIASSWTRDGLPEDDATYNISVKFGIQSFQYTNKWRNSSFKSFTMPFGVSNIGYVLIEADDAVTIELNAVKAIMLVRIDYKAKLIGSVIANYAQTYGKYHFWSPSVNDIMKAAKLKNEIVTTEFLEIRCYVDPKLKIVNKNTLLPVRVIKPVRPFRARKGKIN